MSDSADRIDPARDAPHAPDASAKPSVKARYGLVLAALGVVYGDIGTSPLYALRECFAAEPGSGAGLAVSDANVLGVLSLILWSLVLVISVKYLVFVLRIDNKGEGGILALTALLGFGNAQRRWRKVLILLGLFGAALLYGDGMITPAISVLSAVEGLEVAAPVLEPLVVPISVGILLGLFALQRRGTSAVGSLFGPVVTVWFVVLATLGVLGIWRNPEVLSALSPHHAVAFFWREGLTGYLVLGSVFLVVTGGEALYADMGHFGKEPIRKAWFWMVFPALVLNYFGQGAELLTDPLAAENPFYALVPEALRVPMVILAAMAAVIASQAVISGVFSLTMQAVQLGWLPRVKIVHTSREHFGQIYIPAVNTLLLLATVGLVLGFGSSSALAGAYGVAVTTTMVVTTLLLLEIMLRLKNVPQWFSWSVCSVFLVFDLAFLGANLPKIVDGGWFPLLVGGAIFGLMLTWRRGHELKEEQMLRRVLPVEDFVADLAAHPVHRAAGTAVFLTGDSANTPVPLLHNFKHNGVVHERVVLLTLTTVGVPRISFDERVEMEDLGEGFFRAGASFGFSESPDVAELFAGGMPEPLRMDPRSITFFIAKETLLAEPRAGGMASWRKRLFAFLTKLESPFTLYHNLPPNRVVEMGTQVEF